MSRPAAALVKEPCSNCRGRHLKCDEQKPRCGRCEHRDLDCVRVQKKAVFQQGSTANFDTRFRDQTWVNSKPKKWRPVSGQTATEEPQFDSTINSNGDPEARDSLPAALSQPDTSHETQTHESPVPAGNDASPYTQAPALTPLAFPDSASLDNSSPSFGTFDANQPLRKHRRLNDHVSTDAFLNESPASISSWPTTNSAQTPIEHHPSFRELNSHRPSRSYSLTGSYSGANDSVAEEFVPHGEQNSHLRPLDNVQESCLLRYFIEELSPWFDLCDEQSHFQLVIPHWARRCAPLSNAIFAVSSRHLSRQPKYKTRRGIVYQGQVLPDLTTATAVEYMLTCIPALLRFHEIEDEEYRESIMAAAVVLRQYEEMEEEEMEEVEVEIAADNRQRVNFLAITQAIISTMKSSPVNQSIATAAYWMAVRQEIYYALTRGRPPCMAFGPEDWQSANVANTLIIHTAEVTKWCWGEKLPSEWDRLKAQEQQLTQDCVSQCVPILHHEPDASKGEIFPTIWYSSNAEVTGIQHYELARMILIAENPNLENSSRYRAAHRRAEAQVRSIILNLCGIALNHARCQPAFINAVIGIMLYGEFFIDPKERNALMDIILRTKDMHAWPMRKPYQSLKDRWEVEDCD